jgi:hypothetical protein
VTFEGQEILHLGDRGCDLLPVPHAIFALPGQHAAALVLARMAPDGGADPLAHGGADQVFIGPSFCGVSGGLSALLYEGGVVAHRLSERLAGWRKAAEDAFAAHQPAKALPPLEAALKVYDADVAFRALRARALLGVRRREEAVEELLWCARWNPAETRAALESNPDLKPLATEPRVSAALAPNR